MDTKTKVIEKIVEKKNAFEYINIILVDSNGNKLLNIKKDRRQIDRNNLKSCTKVLQNEGTDKDNDLKKENVELSEIVPEELQHHDGELMEDLTFTEDDITDITLLLNKGSRQYFCTRLKKSNYICFTDCSGLLIARGNFNVPNKNTQRCIRADGTEECIPQTTVINKPLEEKSPILVAATYSGMVLAALGETESDCSVADLVKEIRDELSDLDTTSDVVQDC